MISNFDSITISPCMRPHLFGDAAALAGSNDVAAGPGDAA